MNGGRSAVFAVSSRHSNPVLWNVEQPPYPDNMPAAAAAAISPAADPYARCWQNQVDGTSFPYFGALYNNSLPPTAYRLQAGCMPNLGQFWPPTPPPDGCGRFDGSNLYFGPPVLRHTENISSNIRNSFQGLGHYPHLVETPKEQNQRMFKRETPVSPNVSVAYSSASSKSDSYNSCCVDSKLKPQNSVAYSLPKHDILTVSSGHESYLSVPDSRSSSSVHPSTDKSCMSPPHSLKNNALNNFHCSPQDNAHHRAKPPLLNQENASPLKNVYFSHFESENVSHCGKNFDKSAGGARDYEHKGSSSKNSSKHHHQTPYHHHLNGGGYASPKDRQEYNNSTSRGDGVVLIKEQLKHKNSSFKVKHEKKDQTDCKFQKSSVGASLKNSGMEYNNKTSDVFSIPTSAMHPKIEPSDKYFLPSCSSAAPPGYRYAVYQPDSSYQNSSSIFHNSCSLAKPWQYSELPSISLENYFRSPEAAQLPTHPALQQEVSIAQTAPQEVKSSTAGSSRVQPLSFPQKRTNKPQAEPDDEVQIIGVQNKHSSSKHESRHSNEKAKDQAPVLTVEPLCLKSEKDESIKSNEIDLVSGAEPLSCPSLEKISSVEKLKPQSQVKISKTSKSDTDVSSVSDLLLKKVSVKKELPSESENSPRTAKSENVTSRPPMAEAKGNCDSNASPTVKPEAVESVKGNESEFCVNHGLNLIVKSIEQIAFLEKTDKLTDITTDCADRLSDKTSQSADQPRGLALLSVIAGQRLMSDFNLMKREPEESVQKSEESLLKSNYPDMEGKSLSSDDQIKPKCEAACDAFKSSSVFEMQNRLAELRKKYKQKQRELSRLKPKKRFANSYLKGRQKAAQESCETSISSGTCDSLNSSFCSSVSTDQELQNSKSSNDTSLSDSKNESDEVHARFKRHIRSAIKREPTDSSSEQLDKRVTRRSAGKSKAIIELSEKSRNIKKSLRSKASRLRRSIELSLNQMNDASCSSKSRRESSKNSNSLPENTHKVYSLRHSSQSSSRKHESKTGDSASSSKTLSSKRKSDNPKKYMPSKQSKLSETIIAKQLRNRILFDTSCATSDDENFKDGVPDDLYDAMMNCHLQEPKSGSKLLHVVDTSGATDGKHLSLPEPSKLRDEHLIENQRLLALEDGLFYAGYVKEYHSSKKYGIALDGQRGNRLHMFTREEMLTQTIVESKPLTSELPEGTRVCAYWSQQYRCLYPGVVGKAPCPSADWSEPRVFVLFDDGDSGQIPTKNIRLIPPDIISAETAWKSSTETVSSRMESRGNSRNQSKRLKCSTPIVSSSKHSDAVNETESKESSCGSLNESSCDDSCFNDLSLSPSHPTTLSENGPFPPAPKSKRKRSKRRASSRRSIKQHDDNEDLKESKTKRHKRYKDKHRRRHHHHHRHHHRHHHHHHSKKHKHRRKVAKDDGEHSNTVAANLPQSEHDNAVC